jgi:6-pyruvoyl-tetrahydropterin synthase
MIRYERTVKFSASHYGPWHHEIVQRAEQNGGITWEGLKLLMSRLHGHNFVAQISIDYEEHSADQGPIAHGAALGVWDEDIENWVKEWAGCNISMHPDFYGPVWTSSTENTALVLAQKILKRCPPHVLIVEVTLFETEDIKAIAHAARPEVMAAAEDVDYPRLQAAGADTE